MALKVFIPVALSGLVFWVVPSFAKKKVSHKAHPSPSHSHSHSPHSDPEARALLRKAAPFVLIERFKNDTVRINKDGTFSSLASDGAYQTQGHWKISSGKLKLKWSSGEEYDYRVTYSGRTPLIGGHKPDKERRYTIKVKSPSS